jgi:hypothetical protein
VPAAPLRSEQQENKPIRLMPNRALRGVHRDPVVQSAPGTAAAPTVGASFDAIGQGFTGPQGTFSVTGAPPDTNAVQIGTTTISTFSNLNKATGYTQRSFNVSSFAGQTVTLKFTGTEDSSLQTSFVIDDTALTVA